MAHQSLYRRYRSQKFSELRGQSHVTSALKSAISEGRQSHAYLFSGPRGTGKTSTARILAKALNCDNVTDGEPCCECDSCIAIEQGKSFDLHELDAASHNKVDDVRDLISKVHLGSPGRTKVYILDEVHMLSAGAENALLKTLEEPPAHVVFVLATTEPHKVVPTIRSRTQHFQFHLLPADELTEHVQWIINDAGLDVDGDAVDYVLRQGGGSARDTLSALDLVAAAGGVPANSDIGVEIAKAIGAKDPQVAISSVQTALVNGLEPRVIGETSVDILRNAFLASMGASLDHLSERDQTTSGELATSLGAATLTRSLEALGQTLVEMRQAPDPRVPLEVCLLQLCANGSAPTPTPAPAETQPTVASTPSSVESTSAGAAEVAELRSQLAELSQQVAELREELRNAPAQTRSAGPAPAAEPPQKSGPAAAARSKLREVTAKPPPSPRSKQTTPSDAPSEASMGTPTSNEQPANAELATSSAPPTGPNPDQETSPEEASASPSPALGQALTLDGVIDVFDNGLDSVSQRARVRYKGGRVINVAGSTVVFGVPNEIHQKRCVELRDEVEKLLSSHFGTVSLEVVVDDSPSSPPPPSDPAKIEKVKPPPEADEDVGPVEELADATDQSASGIDRLTDAFPGAKLVEPPPE